MEEEHDRVLDPAAREAALAALLRQHPRALVSAIDGDGLFVEMPPGVVEDDRRVVAARTALELVESADRRAIFEAWDRVKDEGASAATVSLTNGVVARYHFVDVRHLHGVLIGLIVADGDPDAVAAFARREPVLPKTGRTEKDQMAVIVAEDDRIAQVLGYEPGALVGQRSLDLIHPDDQDRAVDAWIDMLTRPGGTSRLRARHLRGRRHLAVDGADQHERPGRGRRPGATEMVDISEEMAAIEQVRQREHLLRRLTEALPSGVLHVDSDRRVAHANNRVHQLLGVPADDHVDPLLATARPPRTGPPSWPPSPGARHGVDADLEVRVAAARRAPPRHCTIALRALTDVDGRSRAAAVLNVADITDEHRMRAELERRATVDELTGCLNRAAVLDTLDRALADHGHGSAGTAVAYFDLDGFKAGQRHPRPPIRDAVLAAVGERLRRAARHGDVVGRIGGDEFIAVLTDVASADDARAAVDRLTATIAGGVPVPDGPTLILGWSVGVAWTDRPGAQADHLIAAADHRMYV